MGFRFGLQIIFCLIIPSLAFAQTVGVSSTVATRLRGATTLPTTCAAGEIYRDSDATSGQQIYLCESTNTWVLQGDGGGVSGWTDDGTELRLTTSTDEVEIGSAATLSAKFAVNGDADEIQTLIQGNATQTNDILVVEKSDGTDILTGGTGGIKVTGNAQVTQLASCETIATDVNGIMRCDPDGGGGGNSFETISVPAGTNPVADSSTDTLTITETTPLTITGTAGTDTIDITVEAGADFDSSGLIEANAVALGTDTTNNYVATIADSGNSTVTVANSGTESAAVTLNVIDVNCTDCLGTTEIADSYMLNTGDTSTGAITITGSANANQLKVTGNATQTNDILVIEKSDGTDILTGATGGIKVSNAALITGETTVDDNLIISGSARIGAGSSSIQFKGGYTSDPCPALGAGGLFYNSTAGEFCYCDNSSVDLRIKDSTTACF